MFPPLRGLTEEVIGTGEASALEMHECIIAFTLTGPYRPVEPLLV